MNDSPQSLPGAEARLRPSGKSAFADMVAHEDLPWCKISSPLEGTDEDDVRALAAGAGLLFEDCRVYVVWRNEPRNCWHTTINLRERVPASSLAECLQGLTPQGWFYRNSDEPVLDLLGASETEQQLVQEAYRTIQKRFNTVSMVDCPATLEWIAPSVYEPLAWGAREEVARVEPQQCDALLLLLPQKPDWTARMKEARAEVRRLAKKMARENGLAQTHENIRQNYLFLGGVGLARFPGLKSWEP